MALGGAVSLVAAGSTAFGGSGSGSGSSTGTGTALPRPFFAGGGFAAGTGVALVVGDSFLVEPRELFFGGGGAGGAAFDERVRRDLPELTSS